MADNTSTSDEYLLLTDESGNYFAIPRPTVEQYRVIGERKQRLEEALGADVSGYSMYQQYMNEYRTGVYQSERRQEAARERSLRGEGDAGETASAAEGGRSIGQLITGSWRRLSFLRQAPTGA